MRPLAARLCFLADRIEVTTKSDPAVAVDLAFITFLLNNLLTPAYGASLRPSLPCLVDGRAHDGDSLRARETEAASSEVVFLGLDLPASPPPPPSRARLLATAIPLPFSIPLPRTLLVALTLTVPLVYLIVEPLRAPEPRKGRPCINPATEACCATDPDVDEEGTQRGLAGRERCDGRGREGDEAGLSRRRRSPRRLNLVVPAMQCHERRDERPCACLGWQYVSKDEGIGGG